VIGVDYNLSRKADPYLVERFIEQLDPTPEGLYLDIGCGTGNYTSEFEKLGFSFIGIDPSNEMLDQAKLQNSSIDWRIGTAAETGLEDECVNGITVCLTIHHWPDLHLAFQELCRVLKGNGKTVIFTSAPEQTKGYWLHHYFPEMITAASQQLPAINLVGDALAASGLTIRSMENYSVLPDLQDLFLYSGKHNPSAYFNEQLRKGISSFQDLASQAEISKGLMALKLDIDSGKVNEIIRSYKNDIGDYFFINAEKV